MITWLRQAIQRWLRQRAKKRAEREELRAWLARVRPTITRFENRDQHK